MKRIILKKMNLVNFKGMRSIEITFNDGVTNIFGRNGAGKTTIFDAFTWLLFGKDSQDRKKFDLKTIDEHGCIISQIPHEVSATVNVNGEDINLVRRFTEKWVRRSGEVERVFDGNMEERFYNDVPCSAKDYDAKIAEICNETIFKFITNPTYFPAQSADAQKAMLQRMAGTISDEEVAADNEDFKALLEMLSGKSLAEFKREISSKKTRINADISDLPGRIDEKKRDLTEDEDWDAIEKEIAKKRTERDDIQSQIDSEAEAQLAADRQRLEVVTELGKVRQSRTERINCIKEEATRDYYEKKRNRDNIVNEIQRLRNQISMNEREISAAEREIEVCASTRAKMIKEYNRLHELRSDIQREQITFNESEFVCPTCKRPLDIEDIEAKQAEMTENFEKKRSERLQNVANDIEENMRLGKANNAKREKYEADIEKYKASITEAKSRIAEYEESTEYLETLTEPDVTPIIAGDSEVSKLDKEIARLEHLAAAEPEKTSSSELKDKRNELTSQIEVLQARLSKRENNKRSHARIAELEKKLQSLNVELAELEKLEYTMLEFSKARSEAIEKRINGLFSFVKFRWIATAINGSEKETCEATLNGRPYSTCSNAERILIGLDIINAICKSQDVYAPIFVDNAESINDIIPMKSQIVSLIVSRDKNLVVENGIQQEV